MMRDQKAVMGRQGNVRRWCFILAIAVIAVALPLLLSSYNTFQLSLICVNAIALLGLNILTGYNGQISIGHGAFYAIGAYVTGILMFHAGVPYWLTIPVAAASCFALGFLFGLPALRLEGHYLALATFCLAIVVPQLLKTKLLENWTGGVGGLLLQKPKVPFSLPLTSDQYLYTVVLIVTILMFVAGRNLTSGKLGRALVAVRDHPTAASTMGLNVSRLKSVTFGISAAYAGVAGALSAILLQFVAPDSFDVFVSVSFLVGIVVGGLESIAGSFIGAAFILLVPNFAQSISQAAPWTIYGLILLLFIAFAPRGVMGALSSVRRTWRK